ncbi:uncharacterized protein VP01_282g4 [Puccinia sorghi]|uniref:Uncharacterized protein n=1 Tax=Puccinia sorghi TaxID=27349 RepID=A0A0L6V413_9BASI|nr:uncharacterized protein VP01_282g4 [Puccinia sorghi]
MWSWMWNYLKESNTQTFAVCQVVKKSEKVCRTFLKKAKSESTKNMHSHLLLVHTVEEMNLNSKIQIESSTQD